MIDVAGLRVTKNGRTICSVPELKVARRERVAVLGPNGSGKTTLLRVLSGLESDYSGDCRVGASWADRVYVHQSPYLFRGTVHFNVTYGLRQRGASRVECERAATDWLERLGLQHMASEPVTHLSGGERRRVALARAMVLRPGLLLLDEPLADVDEEGSAAICAALDDLTESTIVVASPANLPSKLTGRVFELSIPASADGGLR